MKKQRITAFRQIHKGFRALLYHTATTLQQTDFTQPEETAATLEKITQLLAMWRNHASLEDRLLLPLIQKWDGRIATDLKQKYSATHQLMHRILHEMTVYRSVSNETARSETSNLIFSVFHEWVAFLLLYFNQQEKALSEMSWHYGFEKEMFNQPSYIHQIILPEKFLEQSKWILRALNNPEVIDWLKTVKNEAPVVVFQSLLYLAEQELPPHRWVNVQEALCEGAMLA
jgi:hypothetical protein